MDQAKSAAQFQNPNILKIFGIGKVEQAYYISYEHVEGKSLRAILDRCRHEAFPFPIEHALLIASKVARLSSTPTTGAAREGRATSTVCSLPPRSSSPTKARSASRGSGSGPAASSGRRSFPRRS